MNEGFMKIFLIGLLTLGTISSFSQTNDPYISEQWWIKSDFENGGANILKSWSIAKKNYNPKIAIIDSGIDINHFDLKKNISINSKEIPNNNIDDDNNGYLDDYYGYSVPQNNGDVSDTHSHGTHVAGIIAAENNNMIGIAGTSTGSKIIPIKITGRNDGIELSKAILYAVKRGADVINMSIGVTDDVPEFRNAIKIASQNGIIIVASAGNESKHSYKLPARYSKEFNNIIVVASSDQERVMSYFSNYGSDIVHVFAPGNDIYSTLPNNSYGLKSGTSMAAPIVTGIIGLVLQTYGKAAARTMKDRVIGTSHRFESLSGKVYSNGLVDAYNAITGQLSFNFVWK